MLGLWLQQSGFLNLQVEQDIAVEVAALGLFATHLAKKFRLNHLAVSDVSRMGLGHLSSHQWNGQSKDVEL